MGGDQTHCSAEPVAMPRLLRSEHQLAHRLGLHERLERTHDNLRLEHHDLRRLVYRHRIGQSVSRVSESLLVQCDRVDSRGNEQHVLKQFDCCARAARGELLDG